MKTCSTCKFWQRGTITVFAADATDWKGDPHPLRGKTEIERPRWNCHTPDQDVGECLAARARDEMGQIAVAVCDKESIYGELITDSSFGCIMHDDADPVWDHFKHCRYPDNKTV